MARMAATSKGFLRPTTTPTPDEIFDVWLSELSGSELKVLLYIVRRTFGFKKDADSISLSQICKGITTRDGRVLDKGTGLSRNTASKAIRRLESLGLIVVERDQNENGEHQANTYRLRFKGFDDEDEQTAETAENTKQGSSKTEPGVVQKANHPGSKSEPPVVRKANPQQTDIQETESQQTVQQTAPPPEIEDNGEKMNLSAGAGGASGASGASDSPAGEAQPSASSRDSPKTLTEVELNQSVDLLVQFGVWRRRAEKIINQYRLPPDLVKRACETMSEERKRSSFANPQAVLLSRLEAGWEPPAVDESEVPGEELPDVLERELIPEIKRPLLPDVVDAGGHGHDAHRWFGGIKHALQLQLPSGTYNAWLREAELVHYQLAGSDAQPALTIRLPSSRAYQWVVQRLHKVIKRQIDWALGADVEIEYDAPGVSVNVSDAKGSMNEREADYWT